MKQAQGDDRPAPTAEELADAIVATAAAARKLLASRLHPDTIALLISHAMMQKDRLGVREIKRVLSAVADLDRVHLKKNAAR